MDKGRKVCPLDTDDVSVLCCEDKCAWWDSLSGRCCIAKLDVMCSIFEERYDPGKAVE